MNDSVVDVLEAVFSALMQCVACREPRILTRCTPRKAKTNAIAGLMLNREIGLAL